MIFLMMIRISTTIPGYSQKVKNSTLGVNEVINVYITLTETMLTLKGLPLRTSY